MLFGRDSTFSIEQVSTGTIAGISEVPKRERAGVSRPFCSRPGPGVASSLRRIVFDFSRFRFRFCVRQNYFFARKY